MPAEGMFQFNKFIVFYGSWKNLSDVNSTILQKHKVAANKNTSSFIQICNNMDEEQKKKQQKTGIGSNYI